MLIIACLVGFTSRGGVFYRQIRVGRRQKLFKILKFRTMVKNADKGETGAITVANDVRVTRVGRVLRKLKLDELPQLFNVLFGSMSLVGYRPEVPEYVEHYSDEERTIFKMRPGVTGLASLNYIDEAALLKDKEDVKQFYIDEIMPLKLAIELEYVNRAGFFYDIALIFRTFFKIITG
jgi:lipopolysaccharide/colanic/teichoic acid biosynthesis glycosyltransferase